MTHKAFSLKNIDPFLITGPQDAYLRLIEKKTGCRAVLRDDTLTVLGPEDKLETGRQIFKEMIFFAERNGKIEEADVETIIDLACIDTSTIDEHTVDHGSVILNTKRGAIRPKTTGQQTYVKAVQKNDIVFGIGPAGTGKTYLAVAMALAALQSQRVSKIVLTRPAIEAGENLGFLPGDLMEKVDPYLRPLTDALFEMMPADQLQKQMEKKIIEIIPLGYMRGRTLNHSFVILDEAQNTSPMQMKMFLTRLGMHSKAIVTGDITQIDLPEEMECGLIRIQKILNHINNIAFIYLDKMDVVRHRLVREIIHAYEVFHSKKNGENS